MMARTCVLIFAVLCTTMAHAQVYRWDNGQVIPGTEGITLGPGVKLDHQELAYAELGSRDLTDSRFDFSNLANAHLANAHLVGSTLTNANLRGAVVTGAIFGWMSGSVMRRVDLSQANLRGAVFALTDLTEADFSHASMEDTVLYLATLAGARFDGANIAGASFGWTTDKGFSAEQLYSTASYRQKSMPGIGLNTNDLSGWDLHGQNLTNAVLEGSTLTEANLSGSVVTGANVSDTTSRGFTQAQLASTASYQAKNLEGIWLGNNDLTGWDLSGQNLTGANLYYSTLTNANLSGAVVTGASFVDTTSRGLTATQLSSTQSYAAKDLHGIGLDRNNLTGWDFSGQNLTNANLHESTLTNANLTGSDTRGALGANLTGAILRNTILPDGQLNGLELASGVTLVIRDEDGVPDPPPQDWLALRPPIAVRIQSHLMMADGGVLQLVFEADPWDSLISFQPGIPVHLGGTLELSFTDDTLLAEQSGRTIKVFDWTGVDPQGTFAVAGQPGTAWDTSKLYSTGEVTLLGISSDLNSDKDVDSEDLLDFLANWTGSEYPAGDKTWQTGDSDEDGDVDSADMLVFLSQWTGAAAPARVATVPEPTSGSLIGVAITGLLLTHRRRRALGLSATRPVVTI